MTGSSPAEPDQQAGRTSSCHEEMALTAKFRENDKALYE
jgi:hypothetical protein